MFCSMIHGFVAQLGCPHAHYLTFIAVVDGRQEGDVCVGQDDADVHKGLVLGKQAQMDEIMDGALVRKKSDIWRC